jgi:hypothetical protein
MIDTLILITCCVTGALLSLASLLIIAGLVRKAGGRRWEQK